MELMSTLRIMMVSFINLSLCNSYKCTLNKKIYILIYFKAIISLFMIYLSKICITHRLHRLARYFSTHRDSFTYYKDIHPSLYSIHSSLCIYKYNVNNKIFIINSIYLYLGMTIFILSVYISSMF